MGVAFFDLDRTLIDRNSGLMFARFEHREGRISTTQFLRAGLWSLGYHLTLIDMWRAYEVALQHYRGTEAAEVDARTRRWFDAEVRGRLLRSAWESMQWHREQGHRIVLLSNTSNFQAQVATERWGLDDWIANHLLVDDEGLMVGSMERPMCYGEGKVTRSQRWLAEAGLEDAETWFYTDSYSDLPGLLAVTHPRVVNPDPRLRHYARSCGWACEDWLARGFVSADEQEASVRSA